MNMRIEGEENNRSAFVILMVKILAQQNIISGMLIDMQSKGNRDDRDKINNQFLAKVKSREEEILCTLFEEYGAIDINDLIPENKAESTAIVQKENQRIPGYFERVFEKIKFEVKCMHMFLSIIFNYIVKTKF